MAKSTKFVAPAEGEGLTPTPAEGEVLTVAVDSTDGLIATFSTVGGVPPIAYDFGDTATGTSEDGSPVSHTYAADGEYTVTVTDTLLVTDTEVVTVAAVVEPPVEPPVEPSSAYDEAVAFVPDPWDQMPEDPEVMRIYLAINGHLPSFIRHNR